MRNDLSDKSIRNHASVWRARLGGSTLPIMAKSRKAGVAAGMDDCLLGINYPRAGERGPPVAVYSADMIVARLRDYQGMTVKQARCWVTDEIETRWMVTITVLR